MLVQIMIKLYPHFGFFELYNKHKPDWICIHALELHSQMHTEVCICAPLQYNDIKSVNEIRGGAWVEQRQPSPRCSFRNSCHGRELQNSMAHLISPNPPTLLQMEESNVVMVSPVFLMPVINTHCLTCTLLPAVFTHARSFILASSSPFSERSLSFFSVYMFSEYSGFLPHTKPNNLDSVFRFRILIQSHNLLELFKICMGRADATLRFLLFCSFYKGRDMISGVSVNL